MKINNLTILTVIVLCKGQISFGQNGPVTPVFAPYNPVPANSNQSTNQRNVGPNNTASYQNSINRNKPGQQFQMANANMRQAELKQKETSETIKDLSREDAKSLYEARMKLTASYRNAYARLTTHGNFDSAFSLTQAVYLVENAFLNERLPYQKFAELIAVKTSLCREIIKRENLNPNDNLTKNYAIQQLFSRKTQVLDKRTGSVKMINPLQYDFDDFRGDKDWTKMFVSKLLLTGKGQCHSMPLLYLILAEQLKAKASLSLAPDHSYIQFPSGDGNLYNFETTQGKPVTNNAIMMSGFINSTAIKNKLYMDTLSNKQLLALCLIDLEQGYIGKFGYDEFVETMNNKVLAIDPTNIIALMMKSDMKTYEFNYTANKIGRPSVDKLPQYPEAYKLYQEMQALYTQVDNSGYQAMPPEVYQSWLKSLKDIQQQKESKQLQEQIQRKLKLPKSTLKNKID